VAAARTAGGGAVRAPRPHRPKKPRVAAHARGWHSSDEASSGDDAPPGGAFGSRRRRAVDPAAGGAAPGGDASRSPSPGGDEEWALCDACRKWRRLPRGVRGAALPERWTCERGTWGFRAGACGAFTPLSCALAEPTSSGEAEVPPEEGAPEATLWEGQHWLFAYASAEQAQRRGNAGNGNGGAAAQRRAADDGADSQAQQGGPEAARDRGSPLAEDGGGDGVGVGA